MNKAEQSQHTYLTILLECVHEVACDHLGRTSFDLVALYEVYQLAVFKKRYGRR